MEKEPRASENKQSAEGGEKLRKRVFLEIGPYGPSSVSASGEEEFGEDEAYIAADISFDQAKTTGDKARPEHKKSVLNADARQLPFANGSVDRIFFGSVFGGTRALTDAERSLNYPMLMGEEEQKQLLQEAKRVLREDGTLIIKESNTPLPLETLRRLLAENGFVVEKEVLHGDEEYEQERQRYERKTAPVLSEGRYILYAKPAPSSEKL